MSFLSNVFEKAATFWQSLVRHNQAQFIFMVKLVVPVDSPGLVDYVPVLALPDLLLF